MARSTRPAILSVVLVVLLSACATVPPPTPMPTTPAPTPYPSETPLPCPSGHERYVDGDTGFSVCYPSGWTTSRYEDAEKKAVGVDFTAPTETASPVPKRISVRAAAVTATYDEAQLLEDFVIELMNRRARSGQEVVPIQSILVDGWQAAEDVQEGPVQLGGVQVRVTQWMAGFPAYQNMWYISISGPSEPKEEVETIYRQFLLEFHLLPRS